MRRLWLWLLGYRLAVLRTDLAKAKAQYRAAIVQPGRRLADRIRLRAQYSSYVRYANRRISDLERQLTLETHA